MRAFALGVAVVAGAAAGCFAADKPKEAPTVTGPLGYKLEGIDGKPLDLGQYKGKVVLLVNVASECGYTPQYAGLQKLYEAHGKDGLVVVGVPSNDFGEQEPGTNAAIQKFCQTNYKVTFPMAAKVAVLGDKKVPLYKYLTGKETNPKFAGEVGWNFEKFLIGRDGEVAGRFKASVEPDSDELVGAVKKALAEK